MEAVAEVAPGLISFLPHSTTTCILDVALRIVLTRLPSHATIRARATRLLVRLGALCFPTMEIVREQTEAQERQNAGKEL